MAWRTLNLKADNSIINVNMNLVSSVAPSGTGSNLMLASVTKEASAVSISVTQAPATVLNAESVS